MERAKRLSIQAGTLCKVAGGNQPYHESSAPQGRGMRISRGLQLVDHEADASETDTELETVTKVMASSGV